MKMKPFFQSDMTVYFINSFDKNVYDVQLGTCSARVLGIEE